ncbi:MAG TPA: D-glycerate dehydrogenase [Planctomycetota bacterium]|nr:D-glycerate dehydrogenase [Planctomycetota bacterium]
MSARSPILITRKIPGRGVEMLRREFGDVDINPHDRPFTPEELAAEVIGRRGVLCLLSDRIDGHILAAAADCQVFANYAVGYDNIDVPKATRRGVLVANTPGVLTDATADTAWALLMAVARRIIEGDTLVRSGRWTGWKPAELLGADIAGQTLGLVGAGRIGSAVAKRSRGWGMNVLYCEEVRNHQLEAECGATRVEFDVLIRQSDFISIHVPLTEKTRGMFGREQFQAMKESAILVNTSRGLVVDELALVEALRTGEIAGAGLDTYANEPRLAPGLAELDNVVLLPHIGSATIRTRGRMSELAAGAIITALRGGVPQNAVNPEAVEHRGK